MPSSSLVCSRLARLAYLMTFHRLVAGIAARMPNMSNGPARAAAQPAAARRATSAASMTHRPMTNAPTHLASRKRNRYCPTVICIVQRIRAGTLWIVRVSGPRPYVAAQYARLTPYKSASTASSESANAPSLASAVCRRPPGRLRTNDNKPLSRSCRTSSSASTSMDARRIRSVKA